MKADSALQSHGKGQLPQTLLWDSVPGNPSAGWRTLWGQVWPLHVSLREVSPQSVPWDRKCGCMQCQAQTRAEFIHPSSGPNGPFRGLCSQLTSCNSLKPRACVGKMQPSVLEGNLPAIRCTREKISGGWLHWKGFCAKSAWGCGGSKSKSSAVQVPSPQQGSALRHSPGQKYHRRELLVQGFCSLGPWGPVPPQLVLLSCVGAAPVPHQCCLPDTYWMWMAMGKMCSALPRDPPYICLPCPKVPGWLCET